MIIKIRVVVVDLHHHQNRVYKNAEHHKSIEQ